MKQLMKRLSLPNLKLIVKFCLLISLVVCVAMLVNDFVERFTGLFISTQNQLQVLQDEVMILRKEVTILKNTNIRLMEQLEEQEDISAEGTSVTVNRAVSTPQDFTDYDSGFRSWMSSSTITDSSSRQYKVISLAEPNSYGLLEIEGKAVVAVGSGWSLRVGDTATVVTNNTSYEIVVGDIKSDRHTDSSCKVTMHNGCVVEFIVDRNSLNSSIATTGNVAVLSQYKGKVSNITKTGSVL